jgi:hypothetical protein
VSEYSPWNSDFPTRPAVQAAKQGSLLYIDWSLGGSDLTWAQIASGAADARINAEAKLVKAFARPIMISFQSEVDQPRYAAYGTPAEFVAAWRHIHKLFATDGARNVLWVWALTGDTAHAPELPKLYPGNAYVDWIVWDAYNWDGCKGGGKSWRSFEQIASPMYEWLADHSGKNGNGDYLAKPWGLGEYGTVDGGTPSGKALWFKQIIGQLKNLPRLKALMYLDANDVSAGRTCQWEVNSAKGSLAAFREAGDSRYVSVMPFANDSDQLKVTKKSKG